MSREMNRRQFLGLVTAGSLTAIPALPQPEGRRVVVLGAGLAGLAAAWNLMNNGYDVIVLEAQDIPGGRVKTVREPFKNGGYAEAGAIRIFDNHRWTLKYIKLMGLESKLGSYNDDTGAHLWYLQGKRFITPKGQWPLDGLSPKEKPDPFALVPAYWGPGFEAVGDPTRPSFPHPSALALDPLSLAEYFKKNGASDAWIRVLLALEGDAGRLNALAVTALESPHHGETKTTYGLIGGNDQLPKAIAARLGGRVKYNSPVVRLAHRPNGVAITFRDATGQHQIGTDHCICTLPFPVLRQVEITPAFSDQKMRAIRMYDLMTAARVYFQTKTRFWRNDPLGSLGGLNMVGTDTAAGRIFNTSVLQPDRAMGMLQSYIFDGQALAFAKISKEDRVRRSIEAVSEFLPGLGDQVEATYTKAWHEDPWARGAMGFIPPGDFKWMWPASRQPEGRVHFGGEHTSVWVGFQNGALESAERCVREIIGGPQ